MNHEDKAEFAKLMAGVAELHGKKLSTQLLEIYWRALAEYNFADVKKAINQQATDPDCGQFMPKPADIIRFLVGNSNEKSLHAWSKVLKAICSIGCYHSIVFDDAIIHAVIDEMGGWIKLCQTSEDILPFLAKEFQKRYHFYLRQTNYLYQKKLIGIIEHTNSLLGHKIEPEVLFGDQTLALQVFRNGYEPQQIISTNTLITQNLPSSTLVPKT